MAKSKYPKPSRFIDLAAVKQMKELPCHVCGDPGPNDCHHLRTRGAGGGDEIWNLMTLCRMHHMESHRAGLKSFASKYRLPISWERGYPEIVLNPQLSF